ncbi:hypothetical protein Ocin01_03093 [Orchesella cincta]|uniref:Uncharacterized protein n=1 Tax=Orchesella cincta TaxID=48709 RepID=A0A1D2NEE4_ORCCI|nr:hypothetical protein Ocin01_03093 [Orchesella cincta]
MAETRWHQTIINILIWIPTLFFVMPGILILHFYKKYWDYLVTNFLKPNFRSPKFMDMTMCQGNSYEYPNTNAAQIWVVQGSWISATEFSEHFHKCFLQDKSDRYRNLYAHVTTYGTYSYYSHCEPKDLDLSWHIREYKLNDYGQGTLESWAATWMTTNTYEVGRPIWQVAILHFGSLESGTMETGIVAKFSHSLIDGYSFIHMVSKLTDNPAPYVVPSRTLTWKDKLKYIYQSPYVVLGAYGNQAFSRDSQTPYKKLSRSLKSKPQKWLMSFATLDLQTVKMIRKATDTHFICLMLAAQFGALRKLLLESMSESELPENLWIGSSLAWPNHPLSFTNHWTMGFFKCPVKMRDPLERLRAVESFYREYKAKETDTKGMFSLMALLRMLPTWARRFFCHNDFALTNLSFFFASLMLSAKQHYLLGRKVKKLYLPLACPDVVPVALYGVTTSHSGQIDLSIDALQSVVVKNQAELDRLTQVYFTQELEAIADRCGLKIPAVPTNGIAMTNESTGGGGSGDKFT